MSAINYCTLEEVKTYITSLPTGTADDAIINRLISQASREIDNYTNRRFYPSYETRYYNARGDVNYRTQTLQLDTDLLAIGTLTNGNGTAIPASAYVLNPANYDQKYNVQLKWSSNVSWDYNDDWVQAISVTGTWGFNFGTVPPQQINDAAARFTAWLYAKRDAPFEIRGLPDDSIVEVPTAMPQDIKRMLAPYIRREFRAIDDSDNPRWGWR